MKSRTYLQLLASQLLVGASSALLFAWSHDENAPVLPRQTDAVKNHLEGRSPAPEPTSPPAAVREPRRDNRLAKRAVSLSTCGFRDGNEDIPLECASGYYCFNDPEISMVDCCKSADVQDCTAAVTCLDRTQAHLYTGGNTWLCDDSEFSACVTLRYGPGSYSGSSWIACGRTADDFGTAYYGTTDIAFESIDPIVVPDPVTITITPTPEPAPSSTFSSSTSSTAPPTPTAEASSVPIGPIVGGAVGGVALIALIGFGIFFLVFRRRRQDPNVQSQQIQPQPVVSQVAQTPTPGPGPGPSSPSSPVSGIAANAGDIKGGYFQSTYGASPPMSPVPPYSSSPPPMQGAVSPMSMSAMTTSQFAVPTPSNGSQSPQPQMGLGVQGMQGQPQQQQQQQQQQQYYQPQPQQQQQQQQQTNQGYAYHQYGQAAELDTARGDGEVRELA